MSNLEIRDFTTMCTCTCQHYCAIFMHSAYVHMYTYVHYAATHVTCVHVGMRLYMSTVPKGLKRLTTCLHNDVIAAQPNSQKRLTNDRSPNMFLVTVAKMVPLKMSSFGDNNSVVLSSGN